MHSYSVQFSLLLLLAQRRTRLPYTCRMGPQKLSNPFPPLGPSEERISVAKEQRALLRTYVLCVSKYISYPYERELEDRKKEEWLLELSFLPFYFLLAPPQHGPCTTGKSTGREYVAKPMGQGLYLSRRFSSATVELRRHYCA